MGGEELKVSLFALLLTAGLFVQISFISAQEVEPDQGISVPVIEDPLRTAEETLVIGGNEQAPVTVTGSSAWIMIRMILVLALAAAAIYGVVFFIKRSSKPAAAADPFLKVLATAPLGANRYAHIVAVGGKAWLLGSSDGGVNLIGEVDDKDIINSMLLEDSRKSAQGGAAGKFPDFLAVLRRLGAATDSKAPGADDIRKSRERLKGL